MATASFAAEPASVAAARRFVSQALIDHPVEVLAVVQMMVSELATNAVEHARVGFTLMIRTSAREVRVEVSDGGGGNPRVLPAGPDALRGRGLQIVDMLSSRWGVDRRDNSETAVWFTVALRPKGQVRGRQSVTSMR